MLRSLELVAALAWSVASLGRDAREPVKSREIGDFSARDDVDGLHKALTEHFALTHRVKGDEGLPLREELVAKGAGSHYSTAYKLDHDIEQLEYIAERTNDTELAERIRRDGLPKLRAVRRRVPPLSELERTKGLYAFRPDDQVQDWYNRAINVPECDDLPLTERDWSAITKEYFSSSVTVVDDILTPAAFEALRDLLLTSTVFYETKMPEVFGGYVGAIVEDGLHAKALLKLAQDLRRAMPEILRDHPLRYLWVYKYSSDFKGINVHADEAAVNVNLWLTPDDANLDPQTGGLVVYRVKPDESASIVDYNAKGEDFFNEQCNDQSCNSVSIPYKANRAVIFDSAFFHKTDTFHFKPGYLNRRINLTLLFGDMRKASENEAS